MSISANITKSGRYLLPSLQLLCWTVISLFGKVMEEYVICIFVVSEQQSFLVSDPGSKNRFMLTNWVRGHDYLLGLVHSALCGSWGPELLSSACAASHLPILPFWTPFVVLCCSPPHTYCFSPFSPCSMETPDSSRSFFSASWNKLSLIKREHS